MKCTHGASAKTSSLVADRMTTSTVLTNRLMSECSREIKSSRYKEAHNTLQFLSSMRMLSWKKTIMAKIQMSKSPETPQPTPFWT
jgi:hypothetical protein